MSAAEVVVRAPVLEDCAAMIAIERACFSDPWEPENFYALVSPPSDHCRVALREGKLLGYWIGSRIDDEAELANLAVDPGLRRAGVGMLLLEDFLEQVGAALRTTVFLEVRASNDAALRLYRRYGFVELARRKGYYHQPVEDALVMARKPGRIRFQER